jgi:predicted nuclease with TOPRIM domain
VNVADSASLYTEEMMADLEDSREELQKEKARLKAIIYDGVRGWYEGIAKELEQFVLLISSSTDLTQRRKEEARRTARKLQDLYSAMCRMEEANWKLVQEHEFDLAMASIDGGYITTEEGEIRMIDVYLESVPKGGICL